MRRKLRACERFVRAAYRRMVLWRMLEGAGLGVGVASVLGAVLVVVMMMEGKEAWGLAGGMLALGMVVGLVWGLIKRPTELDVATEADRQLRLHDLLGTALLVLREKTNDGWSQSVVSMADTACGKLSSGTLVMNRLGARMWGGIGVSAALLLTLALMSSLPDVSQARSGTENNVTRTSLTSGRPNEQRNMGRRAENRRGFRQRAADSWTERAGTDDGVPESRDLRGGENRGSSRFGGGSTAGRTADLKAPSLEAQNYTKRRTEIGRTAWSGGGAAGAAGGGADSAGFAGSNAAENTPAWRHEDWSKRKREALQAVQSGRVPDVYRPVIREYFKQTVD